MPVRAQVMQGVRKVALPETVGGLPVETWAIETFLRVRIIGHGFNHRQAVLNAIANGANAVRALQSLVEWGGVSYPEHPTVMWDETGISVWPDGRREEQPAMTISFKRVVEVVANEAAGQLTLF